MNNLQSQSNSLTAEYLITARQFVAEDYVAKIAACECAVYEYLAPPSDSVSELERWAYREILKRHGNAEPIEHIEKVADGHGGYYIMSTFTNARGGVGRLGVNGDHQLLVIPRGVG